MPRALSGLLGPPVSMAVVVCQQPTLIKWTRHHSRCFQMDKLTSSSKWPYVKGMDANPILQIRKLRHREVEYWDKVMEWRHGPSA